MSEKDLCDIKFRIRYTMLPISELHRRIGFYTQLLDMDLMRLRNQPHEKPQVDYLGYGSD